jgi:hypothetical protein
MNAGSVSIDGEEYVPRKMCDELREERDRLAEEIKQLKEKIEPAGLEPPRS